jgi:hypothetical protein
MKNEKLNFDNLISMGSLIALAGYILSGPIAFVIVKTAKPQPAWISSFTFAQNYHVIQDLPYYFGFLLIGGMLMISAGHYLNFSKADGALKKFSFVNGIRLDDYFLCTHLVQLHLSDRVCEKFSIALQARI